MTREDSPEENSGRYRLDKQRRMFLKSSVAGAFGGSTLPLLSESISAASSPEEVLFETDFETYDVGTYPNEWTPSGNRNQKVVSTTAGSGSKSFRMSGSSGGCWEAISHHPVQIPDNGTVRIEGQINPTSHGAVGCHKKGRGIFLLRTKVSNDWYPGKAVRLFIFGNDGVFYGTQGSALGPYEPNRWYDFTVEYVRADERVTQTYWLNGEKRGEITREVTDFEDDLSAISLQSGDFTVYWDGLTVKAQTRPSSKYATKDALSISNVTYEKREKSIDSLSAPENEWVIGDLVTFTIEVSLNGNKPFKGDVSFGIDFRDRPGEGIDVDWFSEDRGPQTIYRVTANDHLYLTPDSPVGTVKKEIDIEDSTTRLIEGVGPSLTITDEVRVIGLDSIVSDDCWGSSVCIAPQNILIRAGFSQYVSFLIAVVTAVTASGPAAKALPGKFDALLLGKDATTAFTLAMIALQEGNDLSVKEHFEEMFTTVGYSEKEAQNMAEHGVNAFRAFEDGDNRRGVTQTLKIVNEVSVHLLLHGRFHINLKKIIDYLVASFINAADIIPSLARSSVNVIDPNEIAKKSRSDMRIAERRQLIGDVVDPIGNPVANATVKIYTDDPTGIDLKPYAEATTDGSGAFNAGDGPDRNESLFFEVYNGDVLLHNYTISRGYFPDAYYGGVLKYDIIVDNVTRPEVDTTLSTNITNDDLITAKLELAVSGEKTDVTSWGSGGVHLRVIGGNIKSASKGHFSRLFYGNTLREHLPSANGASIVELTTDESVDRGVSVQTGDIVIEPEADLADVVIVYRGWGYDTENTVKIDGEVSPFIVRAPAGPNYNRHEFEDSYTFLMYPAFRKDSFSCTYCGALPTAASSPSSNVM